MRHEKKPPPTTDEILSHQACRCGHSRIAHEDGVGDPDRGHGRCWMNGCTCQQFVWESDDWRETP